MNIWGLKKKFKENQIILNKLLKRRDRSPIETRRLQRKVSLYKNLISKERELRKKKK